MTWGFGDAYTWLDRQGGSFYPAPWDSNLDEKTAYWSMYNLLESTAGECTGRVEATNAMSLLVSMISFTLLSLI